MQLHEERRAGWPERNYYSEHLASWREIRDALAQVESIDEKAAHQLYNELLKSNPRQLAAILRTYSEHRK